MPCGLQEFQESIKALTSQLEQLVPNLKALEQYEAVRDVERQHNEQLEEAKSAVKVTARQHKGRQQHGIILARPGGLAGSRQAMGGTSFSAAPPVQAATAEFNRVQQERLTLFMDAFEHVSRSIDQIYKELTRSDVHVYGGTAYLALEAPENPFAGGVKYTAMPPSKRFREMELLSGGEKTVAALALLFAIHSFRPSPFFVLDEVDAALDASNIAKVASYIQQRSRAGAQGRVQVRPR